MSKPVIVIDLDNVLAESAEGFVEFSNIHFGTSITTDDFSEDWQTMWGVSHEEAEQRGEIMRQYQIQRDYKSIDGAKDALVQLKLYYELIVLTSRRKESEQHTKDWLDIYFPGIFSRVIFSGIFEAESVKGGHLLTKGQQYLELEASYVIDDHLKHCESASQASAEAILFGDYPWNTTNKLPKHISRCSDWKEVERYFQDVNR